MVAALLATKRARNDFSDKPATAAHSSGVDDFRITALCARREEDAWSYVRRGEGPPQRPPVSTSPGDPLAVGVARLDPHRARGHATQDRFSADAAGRGQLRERRQPAGADRVLQPGDRDAPRGRIVGREEVVHQRGVVRAERRRAGAADAERAGQAGKEAEETYKSLVRSRDVAVEAARAKIEGLKRSIGEVRVQQALADLRPQKDLEQRARKAPGSSSTTTRRTASTGRGTPLDRCPALL